MRLPDPFIQRIEQERARVSHEALSKPGTDLFAYGRAVGFYAGLDRAKQIMEELLADAEEHGRRL